MLLKGDGGKQLCVCAQNELSRNHCRPQRIDIWQQAVDTDVFNPAFRSQEMRARMSGGKPDSVILTYVGRLGAGGKSVFAVAFQARLCTYLQVKA